MKRRLDYLVGGTISIPSSRARSFDFAHGTVLWPSLHISWYFYGDKAEITLSGVRIGRCRSGDGPRTFTKHISIPLPPLGPYYAAGRKGKRLLAKQFLQHIKKEKLVPRLRQIAG